MDGREIPNYTSAEPSRKLYGPLAFGLLAYVVCVGLYLLYWNDHSGGLVQQWYAEYEPDGVLSGSGKWRSIEGKAFQDAFMTFGIWVYPASVIAAGLLLRAGWLVKGWPKKALAVGGALLALYVLFRWLRLGLWQAVFRF